MRCDRCGIRCDIRSLCEDVIVGPHKAWRNYDLCLLVKAADEQHSTTDLNFIHTEDPNRCTIQNAT